MPHWLLKNAQPIAYKTGTSYGFRDAWAAGFTDNWTVIVWTGRPDGEPRVGKTGRGTAAPLLFEVFASLLSSGVQGGDGNVPNVAYERIADAPRGVKTFGGKQDTAPVLLFPPDGAEIAVEGFGKDAHGLTLTARSLTRAPLTWYVDGKKQIPKTAQSQTVWHPAKEGFYKVSVVDENGSATTARVRVMAADG